MALIESIVISLVVAAVALVLSELLRKKPKFENDRPASAGEFNIPTAVEGRVVPVVWGTVMIKGPNVVWWGNLRAERIRKTFKTGLWSSKRVTIGHRYFMSIQFALCRGQIDQLSRVLIGEKTIASGTVQDGTYTLQNQFFFGGPNAQGGIDGTLRVHSGTETQAQSAHLAQFQTPLAPNYRGTAYAVWEGGYLGNSESLQPWAFEVKRFPNPLGLTGGKEIVNSADANPANVLYEILTNDDFGFGFPAGDIDIPSFTSAANTLFTEGNGWSFQLERALETTELIKEVERQIDGIIFLDQEDGKFKLSMARGGYDVDLLEQFDSTNVVEVKEFTRGTWDETSNQVRVEFTDRAREYFDTFAESDDLANQQIQGGEVISVTQRYPGVKDRDLANQISARELRQVAIPLAKATIVTDRTTFDVKPNDVIAFTDGNLGFTKLPMRVSRIDYGELERGIITYSLLQDVFQFDSAFFGAPEDPLWVTPDQDVGAFAADEQLVIESPFAITRRDPDFPEIIDRVLAAARRQTGKETGFRIWQRNASGTPSGAYTLDSDEIPEFLFIGTLGEDLTTGDEAGTETVRLDASPDVLTDLQDAFTASPSDADIGQNLVNICYIGGATEEFIAVTSVVNQTTHLDLQGVWRGMLDTVAGEHTTGDPVFLLFAGGDINLAGITPGNNVDVQLRALSLADETTELEATTVQLTMDNRARKPYPPAQMQLNGTLYDDPVDFDDLKAGGSNLDERGIEVQFNRRDYRTLDETRGIENDAASFVSDFPAANTTEYRGKIFQDASSLLTLLEASWKLGETGGSTRLDDTANDNDLTDNNTVAQIGGKIGNAADFGGTNQYLSIADNASLSFGDEGLTITGWLWIDVNNVNQGMLAKWDRTGSDREYGLLFLTSSKKLRFTVSNDGTASTTVDSDVDITIGSWFFVRAWHDPVANEIGIQIDNGNKQTAAHTTGINDGASPFEIGRFETGAGFQYLNGRVDAVTVHRRVLTDGEASQLYNSGAGQQQPFAATELFTVDFADTDTIFFSRTEILQATGGSLPSSFRVEIDTRHTFETVVRQATQALKFTFDRAASTLDNDTNLGVLDDNDVSNSYTAPDTGTYTFNVGTDLFTSGDVEARINGGGWSTVIAGGAGSTGTLAGVTASDTIEVRHTQTGGGTSETFLEVVPPTSSAGAYGVLQV